MDQLTIGKLLRLGGAAATVGVGASVHALARELPIVQIMALRAILSGILILCWAFFFKLRSDLLPRRWTPHLIRGGLACVAMALAYFAIARLPLAHSQTLSFLAPLLVAPIAWITLGERPGARVFAALALGFMGVLLILGLSVDTGPVALWGALAGIGSAVLVAIIQIRVRAMTASEPATAIALSFTVIVAVVASLSALFVPWVMPQRATLWILAGAGVCGALNIMCFTESLVRAPASTVAPLDYSALVWALLIDWLVFAQLPGALGITGSLLITLAALLVVLRRPG